ncbi:hypothetical protein THIAE_05980 [Thiomicrospira aerophila AL3]|uniref:Uncharacterized protein n=1 Tax=Thiomicrospira aerophila AL3 TaxID=717772 RepID=W0DUL5_9GAMM|nr:hypothetical protein THIAE_05980 [Thiomicrospira aerophila AL3]
MKCDMTNDVFADTWFGKAALERMMSEHENF